MYWSLQISLLISVCSLSVGHRRVYHLINDNKTWKEAEKFCQAHYTDLATVNEQTDVSCVCPEKHDCEKAWARLNFAQPNNAEWRWIHDQSFKKDDLKWENISATQKEGNCAYVNYLNDELLFYNRSCIEEGRFICRVSKDQYKAQSEKRTWCDALDICKNANGRLVNKHDLKNANFIQEIKKFGVSIPWWIGLFRAPPKSSNKNDFCSQQQKACAKLDAKNKWVSHDCTHRHSFICYDDHMVLVKENKTWEEALVHCRRNYGELAMMTDKQEQRKVLAKAQISDSDNVWVGLHFSCFFEEWMWVNGHWVSSDDKHWETPNERPDCNVSGAMHKTRTEKWVKRPSGDRYNFVCAIHCGPNKKKKD